MEAAASRPFRYFSAPGKALGRWIESRILEIWWVVAAGFVLAFGRDPYCARPDVASQVSRSDRTGPKWAVCEQLAQGMAIRTHPIVRASEMIKVPLISGIVKPCDLPARSGDGCRVE